MSLAALIELGRKPRLDPDGDEYYRKEVVGASNGHWRVEYTYHIQGGYKHIWFWERMSNLDMEKSGCYADDYCKEEENDR